MSSALPAPVRNVPTALMIYIEKRDDVYLLHFRGNFNSGEDLEYLHVKMAEIRTVNCPKVLVDFQDVPAVGSTGLSFLVDLCRSSAGRFVLVNTQRCVREVLDITHLSTVLPLAADVESGLAALRQPRNDEASVAETKGPVVL